MADRNVTVLNPAGYQEQLPDTDNLVLTLAPSQNQHGSNKKYVDDTVQSLRTDIENAIDNLEGEIDTDLTLYVQKAGSTMTGTLDWNNDTASQTAYIERTGDAFFQNLDVNFNMSCGSAQFSGTVTCDLNLDVEGNLDVGGNINATNGDFTGDVSLAQLTVDQINLRNSNSSVNGFINNQNFQVSDTSLSISNLTGPLNLSGTTVTTTGQTFVNTSLHVGDATNKVIILSGNIDASGNLTVAGDGEFGNFNIKGIKLVNDGYIDCNRQAENDSIYRGKLNGAVKIDIHANGDVDSDGTITAAKLDGDIDVGEY